MVPAFPECNTSSGCDTGLNYAAAIMTLEALIYFQKLFNIEFDVDERYYVCRAAIVHATSKETIQIQKRRHVWRFSNEIVNYRPLRIVFDTIWVHFGW